MNEGSNKINDSRFFIGFSTDENIRFKASSGGVGSALIKYLMESCGYGTTMSFIYNANESKYDLKLIYDYHDYNNCGSIYQDTDTIGFIKRNIEYIRDGIVVTCMPCQVKVIKSILSRNNIRHFIISLCCSGQTTIQGTWCYYKLLGIKKEDVNNIQYRGNGWPSGIQIQLRDGRVIRKGNYTYPWTLMHRSLLFRPKRCLSCTIKTSPYADVSLADPWLKDYIEKDSIGNTIIICNDSSSNVIKRMCDNHLLKLVEITEKEFIISQKGSIEFKARANHNRRFNAIVAQMGKDNSLYKRIMTSSSFMLKIHQLVIRFLQIILRYNR